MADVQVILWDRERLTHYATYRILCGSTFQRLGMSEENRRRQFHLSNKPMFVRKVKLTPSVFLAHAKTLERGAYACTIRTLHAPITQKRSFLRTNFIFTPTSLKEHVCMQTTHHVERATFWHERSSFRKTLVYGGSGKIYRVHSTSLIFVEQCRCQLSLLRVFPLAQ